MTLNENELIFKSLIVFLNCCVCPSPWPFCVSGLQGRIKTLQVPWNYLLPLKHNFNFDLSGFKKSVCR